jgi:hypothetical protein
MADTDDTRRRANFPREGFLVHWGRAGVRILVTDYHAEPLTIPWDLLDAWRAETESSQSVLPFESPGNAGTPGPAVPPMKRSGRGRKGRGKKKRRR